MQQASDFRDESRSLATVIAPLNETALLQPTQFKRWNAEDVVGHLYLFNRAAELALENNESFKSFFAPIARDLNAGKSLLDIQNDWLGELRGRSLVDKWQQNFEKVADRYENADPKQRISWAGPDMSARSSITARQMETWAHGQAVFDLLSVKRVDEDRIKNIAHLGVNTFGWAYKNRGLDIPENPPSILLDTPSGEQWSWNEPQADNLVTGSATEFCQVVTQTRNVADTQIKCVGETATQWMNIAQCFAGPPVDGPIAGTRFLANQP